MRRGDTKGSCITGDAGDHSVRKPTYDRALFCWHQALGLSIWTSCASKSPFWQNEGKISVQPKHGEAPTFLRFTRLLAKIIKRRGKWMSKNPNRKSNDDDDNDDNEDDNLMIIIRMMTIMLMIRHCEGAAAWRDVQGMWREFTWGGGMELDIHSWPEISGSEKRAPHDVHGCSLLNSFKQPFGGIHCQTHASCEEKKNTMSVSTKSNVSFCGTYGCSNLSFSSHRWVHGK